MLDHAILISATRNNIAILALALFIYNLSFKNRWFARILLYIVLFFESILLILVHVASPYLDIDTFQYLYNVVTFLFVASCILFIALNMPSM